MNKYMERLRRKPIKQLLEEYDEKKITAEEVYYEEEVCSGDEEDEW